MYKVIDKEVIFQFLGEDRDLLPQMMEMILTINLPELKGLPELYENGLYEDVRIKVHKAKSTMGYLGALEVKQLLQSMEKDIPTTFPEKYDKLQGFIITIEKELNNLIGEL
ncbi:hypothetical protein QWY93_16495 [Echinicola jeungdonensis]|uniref:HPt domain-containing protein n=1 Tax=Echinicola jeungdonensis TaxID=709343 RepID=A0ABV5J5K1_9BACT|nr:hypothetical protein [Echinicola jeungdonensis]MDN3670918.1 hypothetical protein [Echinicola jeungdonensis]